MSGTENLKLLTKKININIPSREGKDAVLSHQGVCAFKKINDILY